MPTMERCLMVEVGNNRLGIAKQCGLLSLHRSRFYYEPVLETAQNLAIMRWLDEQYYDTPFYGVLRLQVLLVGLGHTINAKKLRRLMKLVGWRTLYQEPRTTIADKASHKYPYLLKGLGIAHKNQVWEIDITYLPMAKGFMYLYAIMDVYSRYIVAWDISNSMTAEWCAGVTGMAIKTHGKPQIINSDQGSQFTAAAHVDLLKQNGILISMDGKGRAIDNIFIERFWRNIKYENIYLHSYENGLTLYRGVDGYMQFYNAKRPHQSLGYKTPEVLYLQKMAA